MTRDLLLIAHRGSSGTAPENTVPAFQAAAEAGADMIELDVRLSADGVLIVLHDATLRRTTGSRRRVRDLASQEITGLDAGARFGPKFRGTNVPSLASVLAWRPRRLGINVEVKTQGDPRGPSAFVGPLLRLVDRLPAGKLLVSSFDDRFLARLRRTAPEVPLGCLYTPSRDRGRGPVALARATGASVFICSASQARPALVRAAHAGGLAVYVYGINTVRQARLARTLAADGIITDVPGRLRPSLIRTGRSQ